MIGIVAGRLREALGKPACVVALGGQVGKGSGRSLPGFRLGSAVIAAQQAGILAGGGGHDMAAGFSIEERQIAGRRFWPAFHKRNRCRGGGRFLPSNSPTGGWPFGSGNPEPRFVIPDCRISYAKAVGSDGTFPAASMTKSAIAEVRRAGSGASCRRQIEDAEHGNVPPSLFRPGKAQNRLDLPPGFDSRLYAGSG